MEKPIPVDSQDGAGEENPSLRRLTEIETALQAEEVLRRDLAYKRRSKKREATLVESMRQTHELLEERQRLKKL